jgi:hypothetical protein
MASVVSGFYEGSALADKTFHGFKLDKAGILSVEIINDGETVVVLPEETSYQIRDNDYKHWFWSSDTINFYFNDKGHLIMKMI